MTRNFLFTLAAGLLLCAGHGRAQTAQDDLNYGDSLYGAGNPQGAATYYNTAKSLAETSGDSYMLLNLSSRYLLLKDEASAWESYNYSTSWAYWWGWKVANCSWCGSHPEYGVPALQETVTYYNQTLVGVFKEMGTSSATQTLFQQRVAWSNNLLQPAANPAPPSGPNNGPTLNSVSVSRTTLSHGAADSARHATPTLPDPILNVPGFGAPLATPPVAGLLTVIAAQSNPMKITLAGTGNPVVASAVSLPSCYTLAVAEGLSDSDGDSVGARWTRPATGTLYASVAIPAAGITAGTELATTELLTAYTANSIIWEAPPVGTLIQAGHMSGGKVTLQAQAIDAPTGSLSSPQSQVVDYAQTIHVDIVERCIQKNLNGTFTVGVTANITGNFEPLGKTWFRWAFQGNNTTIVVDTQASNQIEFTVPANESGVLATITVSASSLGSATTTNPSPFLRPVPAPPQSVGVDTFNTGGGSIEDEISVLVEYKNACNMSIAIAAGGVHSMALHNDGTVFAWGDNSQGQLGQPGSNATFSTTPVQVKMANGSPLSGVTAISAGSFHSLAVVGPEGDVYAWGSNSSYQLGFGSATLSKTDTPLQVTLPGGAPLTGAVEVEAGDCHSMARMANGEVYAWGCNDAGELGDGSTTARLNPVQVTLDHGLLTGIKQIAAGSQHSLAVAADGTAFIWGYGGEGSELNPFDGTVGPVTASYLTHATPVGLLDPTVEEVAAGMQFSLARMRDGSVFSWGRSDAGQLSNGSPTGVDVNWPGQVTTNNDPNGPLLTPVTLIAAGNMHSLAVVGGVPGALDSWGNNGFGELGDGSLVSRTSPVVVLNLPAGVLLISAGCGGMGTITGHHSLALLSDGSVWAWGLNSSGQLGNNSRVNSSLPVQVGGI